MRLHILGSVIQPDVLSVHYDPQLWGPEDPNLFRPERHEVKRHSMAFLSFGGGPRSCVAVRFSMLIIKVCLAYLLRYYTVLPSGNVEDSLQLRELFVLQSTVLRVRLEKLQ